MIPILGVMASIAYGGERKKTTQAEEQDSVRFYQGNDNELYSSQIDAKTKALVMKLHRQAEDEARSFYSANRVLFAPPRGPLQPLEKV